MMMVYFSKGWGQGDPGGTHMAGEEDESKIIFEPYNLDNSMAIFHDGQKAAYGVRLITKNVIHQAFQMTLENFSTTSGWSGGNPKWFTAMSFSLEVDLNFIISLVLTFCEFNIFFLENKIETFQINIEIFLSNYYKVPD